MAAAMPLLLLFLFMAPALQAQSDSLPGARPRLSAAKPTPSLDQEIAGLQEKARWDPKDHAVLNQLAGAYIRKARASGDFAFYQKAQSALEKSLGLRKDNYEALKYQTAIHLTRHEFVDALNLSEKTIAQNPNDAWNYGTKGDALVELGRYDEAVPVIQKMVALQPGLASYSRVSYLRELYGDIPGAIEAMSMAARTGSARDPEGLAWCWLHVGYLYFNSGDLEQADANFNRALALFPGYHYALAGRASVKAARKAYVEARELYNKAIAIIPLPEFVAALGDLYLVMERPRDAPRQFDLVEHMGTLSKANNEMYNRQLALFYADHDRKPAEAVELARKEITVRKDIYGYDALAWTLYKNKQYREAAAAMKEALRLGTRDARLFYHAGMIYDGLKDTAQATAYLQRALATNPYFDLVHAREATARLKSLQSAVTAKGSEKSSVLTR